MRVFLDTSFLIAAAGSATGLPRFILDHGKRAGWEFVTSLYCEEVYGMRIRLPLDFVREIGLLP